MAAQQYGFHIDVKGNASQVLSAITGKLKLLGIEAEVAQKKTTASFAKIGDTAKGAFRNIAGLLSTGLGFGGALIGFEFLRSSEEYYNQLEKSITEIKQVLITTGGAAGYTKEQLEEMANSMNKKVIFTKPQLLDAESMLLSFTHIRGAVYQKALPAIADFATRFKVDLTEAARDVGRALNSPVSGMAMLGRRIGQLTPQQKELIKHFVQTGQVAKAQMVIIDALNKSFGGLAEKIALTDENRLEMQKKKWDDIKESIGHAISKLKIEMIPTMDKIIKAAHDIFEWLSKHKDTIIAIGKALVVSVGSYLVITKLSEGISFVFGLWEKKLLTINGLLEVMRGLINPWAAAIAAGFGLIAYAIDGAQQASTNFNRTLAKTDQVGFDQAKEVLKNIIEAHHGFYKTDKHGRKIKMTDAERDAAIGKDVEKEKISLLHQINSIPSSDQRKIFELNDKLAGLSSWRDVLKEMNAKPGKPGKEGGTGGTGGADLANALNTSRLAGAAGGLGEAKVINIHIDTMQKNIGVKESKEKAEDAINILLRTVNNIGYSASSTQ